MNTEKIIILARKHATNGAIMESSARFCLTDAVNQFDAGDYRAASYHALKSLAYSVGVFHADYKKAHSMKKAY